MPKRKRSASQSSSCWVTVKKRRKTRSPTGTAVGDDSRDRESSLPLKSSPRGRRVSLPKSAVKLLPDIHDKILFFDLLSRCKRPRTKMEWEVMAHCFIPKGSHSDDVITGRTLYDFYSILVENGCIIDTAFEGQWDAERDGVLRWNIDFGSNLYRSARSKFMDKVTAFNRSENEREMESLSSFNIDVFWLYILVTKRGGFDRIKSDDAIWNDIGHEIPFLFDAHSMIRRVHELRSLYRRHLYQYEIVYFDSVGFEGDDNDTEPDPDPFGIDLYLEEYTPIIQVLSKYPLKRSPPQSSSSGISGCSHGFWLEMTPNGNHLNGSIFGNVVDSHSDSKPLRNEKETNSGSELIESLGIQSERNESQPTLQSEGEGEEDDHSDTGSVLKSMVHSMAIINGNNNNDSVTQQLPKFAVCGLKGLHPFTRKLIAWMLRDCESTVSLKETDRITMSSPEIEKTASNNPRKQSQNKSARKQLLKGSKALKEYEMNWIIDELIVKMLKMRCCLGIDDGDSSMMRAFESGLDALKTAFRRNPDGYALYRVRNEAAATDTVYYVYYQRIVPSMELFVNRAIKMAHNFLSHPYGQGLMAMSPSSSSSIVSPSVLSLSSSSSSSTEGAVSVVIPSKTFCGEIGGDFFAINRWMERAFCRQKLWQNLQSGAPLRAQQPFWMEVVDDDIGYKLLGVIVSDDLWWRYRGSSEVHKLRVNHSCGPNCILKPFQEGKEVKLGLFTTRDIMEGEELTIDYQWSSSDGDGCCRECICCCGMRQCQGTYVRYKRAEIEDEQYLVDNHHFIGHRLVHLLMATLTPLTDTERDALQRLHIVIPRRHSFGQWMLKYFAFLAMFIESEHSELGPLLFKRVNRRNEYTLTDAQRDADDVMLRRMRALSITLQRITYFLQKQTILNRQILDDDGDGDHHHLGDHQFVSNDSSSMFFLPPIRFAEIDEVIARLWNDSDSLIHRLLNSLSSALSPSLYKLIESVVAKQGLVEESQFGLHLVRRKLIEIAKMLRTVKSNKIHRHLAAADILFLYAHTLRFVKHRPFLSFAAEHSDHGVISSFRDLKKMENRYLTRSVRKESERRGDSTENDHHRHSLQEPLTMNTKTPTTSMKMKMNTTNTNTTTSTTTGTLLEDERKSHSESVRFLYPSHFPLLTLLSWHRHFGPDGEDKVNGNVQREYEDNMYGVALLPDIESCFNSECKGLYIESHRNYIAKCLLERKKWMKHCYTKQYEERESQHINSCPVPQFTFTNALGLFGSPVLDSYIAEHTAVTETEKEDGRRRLNQIVKAMRNNFNFEV